MHVHVLYSIVYYSILTTVKHMGLVVQSFKPNKVVNRSTGSVNANNISKYTGFFSAHLSQRLMVSL